MLKIITSNFSSVTDYFIIFSIIEPGTKSVMTAPKMYNTEYQHVGSNKPITV